jgi:hypothetical protein
LTVLSAPARYWLLYEGTPGGELGGVDLCGRSDGRLSSCSIAWQEDIVNNSGVAPSIRSTKRSGRRLLPCAEALLFRVLLVSGQISCAESTAGRPSTAPHRP